MIALGVPVYAVVVPAGGLEAARIHGRVIGRTWEQSPRYDVRGDDGVTYRGLFANVIERETAPDLPRAA